MLIAGVLSLALVAGVIGTQRSQTPSPARNAGFDGVIQRAATPDCEDPYKVCKDEIGPKHWGCKHTVNLKCCVVKSGFTGEKWDCCLEYAYNLADKSSIKTCCPDPDECKDDKCKATAKLKCELSKAKTWDARKKICDDHKGSKANMSVCRPLEEKKSYACAIAGEGCLKSRCCKDPNLVCYQKDDNWADCRTHCEKGKIDPKSPKDLQAPWSCKQIEKCSKAGEGCLETGCCRDPTRTCYMKNAEWADCRKSCKAGSIDPNSPKGTQAPWSCATRCSKAGDGCHKTGCCLDPDLVCYEKNEKWADCRTHCNPHEIDPKSPKKLQGNWSCKELKPKTWIPPDPTA